MIEHHVEEQRMHYCSVPEFDEDYFADVDDLSDTVLGIGIRLKLVEWSSLLLSFEEELFFGFLLLLKQLH